MRFYFLEIDFRIEDAHLALNEALRLARKCGDPEDWGELAEFIDNIERAKDLLSIPDSIEEVIVSEQVQFDYEDGHY